MADPSLPLIGGEFTGGALFGALIGWGSKKAARIVKAIVGIFIAAQAVFLAWLNKHGIITVHPDAMYNATASAAKSGGAVAMGFASTVVDILLTVFPASSGFLIGLAAGWKKG